MELTDDKIADILVQEDYISESDLKSAQEDAIKNQENLFDFLIRKEIIDKNTMGQAIAEHYKTNYTDLERDKPVKSVAEKLPEEIAKKYNLILIDLKSKDLVFATNNPQNKDLETALKKIFPKNKIILNYSFLDDIVPLLSIYNKSLATRFQKIIDEQKRVAPEILEEIVRDAISFRASDIHFEPSEENVLVRFRVDGVLLEAGQIPKQYYENVLNRIKVLAQLRIDEHFATQDGAIRFKNEEYETDMRVSVAPTLEGEKVVMRVLSQYVRDLTLAELGLTEEYQTMLERAAKKPFGMILVTGPTGSGKTTTLYSLLKQVASSELNITTIEDPVEYKISGTNQIQVNEEKNITFANGLRSIVRQDPDIILVGEIRDPETASIAVNAALTGHLLFSTFHANDAATAIPRLIEMDIEPFLLASTLELLIAQRLVRKICPKCRHAVEVNKKQIEETLAGASKYFKESTTTLYEGKGCESCNNTGYSGRTGVFEFIEMTKQLKELVLTNPSTQDVWIAAKKAGAKSLFEDGIDKVRNGVTTLKELSRVVPGEEK